jgi:SpoVK/Ycf46/Vps4 family AAA+-type ATPase
MPSKTSTKSFYSSSVMDYFKNLGFIEEARTTLAKFRNMERSAESILIHQEKEIIIHTMTNVIRDPDLLSYEVLYNIKRGDLYAQIDLLGLKKFQKDIKKSSIQLVKSDMGHLDTEEYDLSIPELDLELNYGASFIKVHEIIVKRLNINGDKGIILLHGDPGTGKTTYLKYLTKEIKEKNILFIPPSMAEILSEPLIIPFLMENRNSILLIEDAERVIADREGRGSTAGVSNLLNLTDGILGDCLNIQVIATFNMKRERIDPALLRKGRLICEHKFDKLTIKETNDLLSHLHKNIISSEPLTLADIYNIDSDEIRVTKDQKRVSFVQ